MLCSLNVIIIVVVTHMYVVSLGELQQNSGNSSFLVPLPPQSCIRHLQRVDRNQQMLHEVSWFVSYIFKWFPCFCVKNAYILSCFENRNFCQIEIFSISLYVLKWSAKYSIKKFSTIKMMRNILLLFWKFEEKNAF